MVKYKDYIGSLLVNKTIHFRCDCLINIDITGKVIDYEVNKDEIIYFISVDNKIIKIGENTTGLKIEII